MQDTSFIAVRLSEPARTIRLNLAAVAQIIEPENYDNVRVDLLSGESHTGTRAEMRPLLLALARIEAEAAVAQEARELAEEAEAAAELRANWELHGNQAVPSSRGPRERHSDERTRTADYRHSQRELFGAIRDAGLSTEREARIAGIQAFFADARLSSFTQMSIAEMDTLRAAISAGVFNTDWTLRVRTVPGLPVAVTAFFGGLRHAA